MIRIMILDDDEMYLKKENRVYNRQDSSKYYDKRSQE